MSWLWRLNSVKFADLSATHAVSLVVHLRKLGLIIVNLIHLPDHGDFSTLQLKIPLNIVIWFWSTVFGWLSNIGFLRSCKCIKVFETIDWKMQCFWKMCLACRRSRWRGVRCVHNKNNLVSACLAVQMHWSANKTEAQLWTLWEGESTALNYVILLC